MRGGIFRMLQKRNGKAKAKSKSKSKEQSSGKVRPGMRDKSSSKHKTTRILMGIFLFFVLTLGLLAAIFAVYVKNHVQTHVELSWFENIKQESATRFYYFEDYDRLAEKGNPREIAGSELYAAEKYQYASFEEIPAAMKDAFVAIEDKRFFQHHGVDWYRTLGATANYLFQFRGSFGASTITQQLVKNVTGNNDYKVERKIQEIFYAMDLEKRMGKEEILELYLNVIPMSQGCRGVKSAAEVYFSKSLSELTLEECVCLAAITNSPAYYDPFRNPENNKKRRQMIYDQMLEQGKIDRETYDRVYHSDVALCMTEEHAKEKINSWYVDMVIDDVAEALCQKYGYTKAQASGMIYGGGLQIYTLMDARVQKIVEAYYEDESHFPDGSAGIRAQSSMIILDPYTGDILGVAGSRGPKTANRIQNYATQTLRPSGSVIKPLSVYAPAFEAGLIQYASVFDDVPVSFGKYNTDPAAGALVPPEPWPRNAPTVYHGLVNVNYAVEVSLNTVPIRILEKLGKEQSFYFLKNKLGMKHLIESLTLENGVTLTDMDTAALALGQMNYGITVREITAGYTIFPNEGRYCAPRSFSYVTDAYGKVLLENQREERQAISRENSILMTKILKNVVDYGTAKHISLDKTVETAGKTGTSQDYYDRWFIGFTPYYLGGVWYGYEYPKSLNSNTQYVCTKIWNDIMTEIHAGRDANDVRGFAESDQIVMAAYCKDSGKLAGEACVKDVRGDRTEIGYFVRGTEPKELCDCHVLVRYDKKSGGVDCGYCPDDSVEWVGMITVERHFPMQIYISDAQYVYRPLSWDRLPSDSKDEAFFARTLEKGDWCGISETPEQYNRACHTHFSPFWWLIKRKMHN